MSSVNNFICVFRGPAQFSNGVVSFAGLHAGFLFPAVLDRPKTGVQETGWRRDLVRWVGVHQEHMGT